MTTYLSQLVDKIPSIRSDNTSNEYLRTKQEKTPKLKYITIFNPDYISGKGESNEELSDQIFCFITDNSDGDSLEVNKVEQIRTIGLIQAIEGLPQSFLSTENDTNLIHISKSTIIVKRVEESFVIACSISIPEGTPQGPEGRERGVKNAAINQQMIELISKSYDFFKILNTSFTNLVDNYNVSILKNLMTEHWSGFLRNYNSENFKFPPTVKWPNSLNYRGFLGFFDTLQSTKTVYKKSSIDLNYNLNYQIDQMLNTGTNNPQAIIISHFNKASPKKYGLIYCNSVFDEQIQQHPIEKESLIDVYNYLEYFDYHEKLNTRDVVKLSNDDLFSSPQTMKDNINIELNESVEEDRNFLKDSANYAIDLLNPINLTNNLVVSPLNYTVSSMMNFRNDGNWFRIPSYFPFQTPQLEAEEEIEDSVDEGAFLVGAVEYGEETVIERKLVYLTTTTKKDNSVVQEEREYSIVIYHRNGIYISLLFDSSASELDNKDFYAQLKKDVLVPNLEDIEEFLNADVLESSIGSLSVNGLRNDGPVSAATDDTQIDSDFFFIIYDNQENHVKSSLPYLPLPINLEQVNQLQKANLNVRSAMFYLHDQLLDLFFLQKTPFFTDSFQEYFHKFSTNKINDWMFYYLKVDDKYVVIMKNVNHNSKKKKKVVKMVDEGSVEFLSNLGDDVRVWFENYIATGET